MSLIHSIHCMNANSNINYKLEQVISCCKKSFQLIVYTFLYVKAHQRGLKYPLFTFLHPAWWVGNWWIGDSSVDYGCTAEERETVVNHSIAVLLYEYYETLDDVAETGTVSNLSYHIHRLISTTCYVAHIAY